MSKIGTAYINKLNALEDLRLLKKQEQALEFKTIDPQGGHKRKIVNAPVHCVQCGETVEKLIFCSGECEANYNRDIGGWLDGIEELLPSARAKK
jgi:endogenous inhibitor of DNA gyrase (YacG/DUF329 family)